MSEKEKEREKPLNLAANVNPVEITSEALYSDPRVNMMLRDLGAKQTPLALEYLGSFATHIYATTSLLGIHMNVSCITQQVGSLQGKSLFESVSPGLIKSALILQKDEIVSMLEGKRAKTRNKQDKRI